MIVMPHFCLGWEESGERRAFNEAGEGGMDNCRKIERNRGRNFRWWMV